MNSEDLARPSTSVRPLFAAALGGVATTAVLGLLGLAGGYFLVGPAMLPALALAAAVAALAAITVIELGTRLPESAGYQIFRVALPQPFGFLGGWIVVSLATVAAAACALLAGSALAPIAAGALGMTTPEVMGLPMARVIAVVLLLGGAAILGSGVPWSTGRAFGGLAAGLLLAIFAVAAFVRVAPALDSTHLAPSTWDAGGTVAAAALLMLGLGGFVPAARLAEQIPPVHRSVPLVGGGTLIAGIAILALLAAALAPYYTAGSGFFLPGEVGLLGRTVLNPDGDKVLVPAIVLASVVALTTLLEAGGRTFHEMAADHVLPAGLAGRPQAAGMPARAMFLVAILAGIGVLAVPELLVAAGAILILFRFAFTHVALLRLRKSLALEPDTARIGVRRGVPAGVPLLGLGLTVELADGLIRADTTAWYLVALWLLSGAWGYMLFVYRAREEEPGEHAAPEEARAGPTHPGTTVLVGVNDPAQVGLVEAAAAVAHARGSRLVIVTVVPLPATTDPGSLRYRDLAVHLKDLEALERIAARTGVAAVGEISVAPDPVTGIAEVAGETGADLVLLGWRGAARPGTTLGPTIDGALRTLPVDVAVLEVDRLPRGHRDLVVVVDEPLHVPATLAFALPVSRALDLPVVVLSIVASKDRQREAGRVCAAAVKQFRAWGVTVTARVVVHHDPPSAMAAESRGAGLLCVGSGDTTLLRRLGDLAPDRTTSAFRASCPVVLVRAGRGARRPSPVPGVEEAPLRAAARRPVHA